MLRLAGLKDPNVVLTDTIRTMPDPATIGVKTRLEAKPIKRILDRQSREVVGWLYEWDTGEFVPMWKRGQHEDVVYE
ncbi:MAG: hypothetical protein HN863_04970 [Marinovum sp.]|jgi:hypothetical protein|nr:hypothetical protein [Marinovum sp.]MDA9944942.1 hypothetical protein [Paracoccaceae bacterium]